MGNNSYRNELIRKRRKRRLYRKCILLFVLLISIMATLCFKLPYFNISNIQVINNKNISKDEIIKLSDIKEGTNIFYQNLGVCKKSILTNPYIEDISFSRRLPSTMQIIVSERKAQFYNINKDKKFVIIDKNGIVLEVRDDISKMQLVKLIGLNVEGMKAGDKLADSGDKKVATVKQLSALLDRADKNAPAMTEIDITDNSNVKVKYSGMSVMLGNSYDLEKKLNKALNIIVQNKLTSSKGYIDVSYNGNPVVSIEK